MLFFLPYWISINSKELAHCLPLYRSGCLTQLHSCSGFLCPHWGPHQCTRLFQIPLNHWQFPWQQRGRAQDLYILWASTCQLWFSFYWLKKKTILIVLILVTHACNNWFDVSKSLSIKPTGNIFYEHLFKIKW